MIISSWNGFGRPGIRIEASKGAPRNLRHPILISHRCSSKWWCCRLPDISSRPLRLVGSNTLSGLDPLLVGSNTLSGLDPLFVGSNTTSGFDPLCGGFLWGLSIGKGV